MAIMRTNAKNYEDIAKAINTKRNTKESYLPKDMANAILSIKAGGGTLPPQVTNFKVYGNISGGKTTFEGEFTNIPSEQRKWLKQYVVTYKKNAIPESPEDGVQIVVQKTESETVQFSKIEENETVSENYGFRVFPQNLEGTYQTIWSEANAKLITSSSISSTLENNSWEVIDRISRQKQATNYWHIGDTKKVDLNGIVGFDKVEFHSVIMYVFILDFDHNKEAEGEGISFGTFKKTSKDQFTTGITLGSTTNCMNSSATNANGWKGSQIRKVLGSDTQPSSFSSYTVVSLFPSELRAVMKPITKWTCNKENKENLNELTCTTDYLPLLSEYEVFGRPSTGIPSSYHHRSLAGNESIEVKTGVSLVTSQTQYAYYANGNSAMKSSEREWLLRSPDINNSTNFCVVDEKGETTKTASAETTSGGFEGKYRLIAPVFLV